MIDSHTKTPRKIDVCRYLSPRLQTFEVAYENDAGEYGKKKRSIWLTTTRTLVRSGPRGLNVEWKRLFPSKHLVLGKRFRV